MIRGLVKSVVQGVIQRVSATVWGDGAIDNREFFQHWGFTSRPKAGAEVIFIRQGNSIIAVASDDRRYRLAIEEGEAALYDDQGQKVHLLRDRVQVTSPFKIVASSPEIAMVASVQVTMTTPLLAVSGNITAANVTAAGQIADADGAKTMSGMRTTFTSHTHPENGTGGGTTSAPNQGMKGSAILTINDHSAMREIFKGFQVDTVKIDYTLGGAGTGKGRQELIYTNW